VLRGHACDLRPDWSGIYAYGCRAYALEKDREAGRKRNWYKTHPRAHVGYLVGYVASNIYRVWIPELQRVITTRNVAFDEDRYYDPDNQDQQLVISEEEVNLLVITPREIQDAGFNLESLVTRDPEFEELGNEQNAPTTGGVESETTAVRLGTPMPEDDTLSLDSGVDTGFPAVPGGMRESISAMRTPETARSPVPGQHQQGQTDASPTTQATAGIGPVEGQGPSVPAASATQQGRQDNPDEDVSMPDVITESSQSNPNEMPGGLDEQGESSTTQTQDHGESSQRSSGRVRRAPKRLIDELAEDSPRPKKRTRNQVALTLAIFDSVVRDSKSHKIWFFETFFPTGGQDNEDLSREKKINLESFHAVYAAAVSQKGAERMGAAPTKPRYHYKDLMKTPKSYKDLKNHPLEAEFRAAMEQEITKLSQKGTWREIDRRTHHRTLPLKWVYVYKFDANGFLDKCKARICVRGDLQPHDIWQNTYASTLSAKSFRMTMALMAHYDLECEQLDITNAFINASLEAQESKTLCELPDGFKKEGKIVELDKALYGLKESPLLWYNEFTSTLRTLGLEPSSEDPCFWFDQGRLVMLLFFVDDILVLYHRSQKAIGKHVIEGIMKKYEAQHEGDIEWYLGIRVVRDRTERKAWLVHDSYIEKVCKRYNLVHEHTRFPKIPLPCTGLEKFEGQATKAQIKAYQEKVGSLVYCTIMTRPDPAFAATELSRHLQNPGPAHSAAVDQALLYLYSTRYLAIQYGGENNNGQILTIASDASFADDDLTRRSSQGYIFSLFGGPINWKASRQATVTTSTTEAELLALEQTTKEAMALERFLNNINLELGRLMEIYCDNQQTIRLVIGENQRISTKLKHVDIQNMWLRQEYAKERFQVTYLPTAEMPADGLTKVLPRQKFEHFRSLLNLKDIQSKIVERK